MYPSGNINNTTLKKKIRKVEKNTFINNYLVKKFFYLFFLCILFHLNNMFYKLTKRILKM